MNCGGVRHSRRRSGRECDKPQNSVGTVCREEWGRLRERALAPLLRQRLGTEGPPAITLQVEPCDLTLPDAVQPDVVRVVLEAVTNVRRHADALHCTVQVTLDGEEVRVVVDDDGIGPGTTGSGIGLSSIAARTATFHGTSSLLARPGGGSRLTATFTTGTERHS